MNEKDKSMASMCRALGHPVRVRILRELIRTGQCQCGDIVAVLPLAQSTVSQHLKILSEAGLIRGQVDGPRRCYCVNPRKVEHLKRIVREL